MRLLISVLLRCKHSVKPSCTLSFTFCHLNMSRCVLSWEWNGTRPSGTTRPAAQIRPSDFVIFDLSFCTNERKMGIFYERPATSHCLNQCWNIGNRTLGKKTEKSSWNSCIFIQLNAFANLLGHGGYFVSVSMCWRKIAAIYYTTFSNAFLSVNFGYNFTEVFVQLTINHHWYG